MRALSTDLEEHFVTLILARLEPATRRLTYTNAGHPPGYVMDANGNVRAELENSDCFYP